eukprot:UN27340
MRFDAQVKTPLHYACESNNENIVNILINYTQSDRVLDNNKFLNKKDKSGHTAIQYTTNQNIKDLLVAQGATLLDVVDKNSVAVTDDEEMPEEEIKKEHEIVNEP